MYHPRLLRGITLSSTRCRLSLFNFTNYTVTPRTYIGKKYSHVDSSALVPIYSNRIPLLFISFTAMYFVALFNSNADDFGKSNYDSLHRLIEEKQLQLIYIFSIPRSRSTALEKALSHSSKIDAQCNEPFLSFNNMKAIRHNKSLTPIELQNFDTGCKRILETYERIKTTKTESPITIIIKDHTSVFNEVTFLKMLSITKDVIFIVRDPIQLCMSLLVSITKEALTKTGDELSNKNALAVLDILSRANNPEFDIRKFSYYIDNSQLSEERILEVLKKSPHERLTQEDLATLYQIIITGTEEWFSISWENFFEYSGHPALTKHKTNHLIVDADCLIKNPRLCMRTISERLSCIAYEESIIGGWADGRKSMPDLSKSSSADRHIKIYTSAVRESTELAPQRGGINRPVELNELPITLHSAVNSALFFYTKRKISGHMLFVDSSDTSNQKLKHPKNIIKT